MFGAGEASRLVNGIPAKSLEHLHSRAAHLVMPCDLRQAVRFLDFKEYLPGAVLSKVDRMSMLNSLEVRTPFFSRDLLTIAAKLPTDLLYKDGQTKVLLRHIAHKNGLTHLSSLKKQGFGMPLSFILGDEAHVRERFKNSVESIMGSPLIKAMDDRIAVNFANVKANNINSIWATIVLGEWLEGISNV